MDSQKGRQLVSKHLLIYKTGSLRRFYMDFPSRMQEQERYKCIFSCKIANL